MTREELLEIGRRVAPELGPKAGREDFKRATGVDVGQVYRRFSGGWSEFRTLIGLGDHPDRPKGSLSDDELLAALHDVASANGHFPTGFELDREATVSTATVQRRFGGLSGARDKYWAWLAKHHPDSPLIADLEPTARELNAPTNLKAPDSPLVVQQWAKRDQQEYGEPINFRGLRHAPINEQGVVFLFGMVADDLGFQVEAIQGGFPDCEAKCCVDAKRNRWQRVRIEFEFNSNEFRKHGHPIDGCDLIVCWIHNWSDCPLKVIELSRVIQELDQKYGEDA